MLSLTDGTAGGGVAPMWKDVIRKAAFCRMVECTAVWWGQLRWACTYHLLCGCDLASVSYYYEENCDGSYLLVTILNDQLVPRSLKYRSFSCLCRLILTNASGLHLGTVWRCCNVLLSSSGRLCREWLSDADAPRSTRSSWNLQWTIYLACYSWE